MVYPPSGGHLMNPCRSGFSYDRRGAVGIRAVEFTCILRRCGLDPDGIADVAAVWNAFVDFMHVEMTGLDPNPGSDSDGFIVQWGRYSWHGGQLSISFTRQLAIPDEDPDWQPAYWQIDLAMVFDDEPALRLLDGGCESSTGFYFEPHGPGRDAALAEVSQYELFQVALMAKPKRSQLTFEQVG